MYRLCALVAVNDVRSRIRRFRAPSIAAGVVLLIASGATNAHPTYDAPCQGEAYHLAKGKALVRSAFTDSRWRDKTPMRAREAAAYRHHKFCLTTQRPELAAYRHRAAQHHRGVRSRRLFIARYTPYAGPGGTHWAIPYSIVNCESKGNWNAANSSGAVGPYQLLGWGAPYPVTSRADKMAHHRIAARVWAGGAGRSNWVC